MFSERISLYFHEFIYVSINEGSITGTGSRAGLNYFGALCETDCVGSNMGRNKDNNYNSDKCGAFGSAYVAVA